MKIKLVVGDIEVEYDGPEAFFHKRLAEIVGKLRDTGSSEGPGEAGGNDRQGKNRNSVNNNGSLAQFLATNNAKKNQTRKFLATAAWLQNGGAEQSSTGDVSKALKNAKQGKLTNPSDCLAKNVSKGYCEKDRRQFFVLDEGFHSLK